MSAEEVDRRIGKYRLLHGCQSISAAAADTPRRAPRLLTHVKDGKLRLQVLISELEHRGSDAAARCLAEDLDALVAHLRYALRHRERWRSTNLLERSLGEVRRRTKVMGRFPGEASGPHSPGQRSTCSDL